MVNIPSSGDLNVGYKGAALMNITGGSVTVGQINVGGVNWANPSSGSGTLNLSGNASLTLTSPNQNCFCLGNTAARPR